MYFSLKLVYSPATTFGSLPATGTWDARHIHLSSFYLPFRQTSELHLALLVVVSIVTEAGDLHG